MALIQPSRARLIRQEWAGRTPSPLHDALDPVTRATILATNPDSWLHISRRADDQASLDPHEIAHRSAAALERLLSAGAYGPTDRPTYFLYRYEDATHSQTGLVADVPIESFLDGSVLGHEDVEPPRVRALVAHQRHLPMRGDLVALLMPDREEVVEVFNQTCASTPEVEIPGDLRHDIWRVAEVDADRMTAAIAPLSLYIVDGHHRVAAAMEEWHALGRPSGYSVLCLITPRLQLRALAFDRRVVGPVFDTDQVAFILRQFDARAVDQPTRMAGTIGVYWNDRWYHLTLPAQAAQGVDALDVIRLHREILEPRFDIRSWGDPRLEVTSERVGVDVLQYRCDNDGGLAFILKAPSVDAIIEVADRGEQMPFKSTYFDPKPWSGVFVSPPGRE
jgi:uncharacterized protein (DUF1015 family)